MKKCDFPSCTTQIDTAHSAYPVHEALSTAQKKASTKLPAEKSGVIAAVLGEGGGGRNRVDEAALLKSRGLRTRQRRTPLVEDLKGKNPGV